MMMRRLVQGAGASNFCGHREESTSMHKCPQTSLFLADPGFRSMMMTTRPSPSFSGSSNDGSYTSRANANTHDGGFCDGKRDQAPDVLQFLNSLKNYEKLGVPDGAGTDSNQGFELSRMHRLLSCLGNPLVHYPVIHVAGTKGKGSTAAFISSILRAEGYSVGIYTSPHMKSIHERIIAGKTGKPIAPTSFQELFRDNWKDLNAAIETEEGSLTHFEILTALAFKYFAEVKVDIAVVEAGLGGARDATNVISPCGLAVAVLTNIGKEHLAALGGSLESITLAKSGIIKEGRPVVLGGPLASHLKEILSEVAASKNARIINAFGEGMNYTIADIKWERDRVVQQCSVSINTDFKKLENHSLQLQMLGCHQLDNALTAICAILCLQEQGWKVQDKAIWAGLEQTCVAGRFQVIPKEDTLKLLGDQENLALVLDGAHTESSAAMLARTLRMVFPSEPVAFIIAMASDKDSYNFCTQLLPGSLAKVVVTTETSISGNFHRSMSASVLLETWYDVAKENNLDAYRCDDPRKAVDDAQNNTACIVITKADSVVNAVKSASLLLASRYKKGVICVTGSLHAVAAVLSLIQNETNHT